MIETAHPSYANAGKVGTSIANGEVYMFAAEAKYPRGKGHKLLQAAHEELFAARPGTVRGGLAPILSVAPAGPPARGTT